jgi:hypothetical protein
MAAAPATAALDSLLICIFEFLQLLWIAAELLLI